MPGENKLPPQSEEAEKSVLGALLIDEEGMVKVADILNQSDFYKPKHKKIYQEMIQLFENDSPIDTVTLTDRLKSKNKLKEIGGASYLADLANFVSSSAHVRKHAKIIADKATLRRLISATSEISESAFDGSSEAEEILDKAEGKIFGLSKERTNDQFSPIEDVLEESFDRIDKLHKDKESLRGIPTHFQDLDDMLSGLQPSDLIILAGRPSMGKTSLAINFAEKAAIKEDVPVGVFSLEMSKEQLVDRLICSQASVDSWKLRTGNLSDDDFVKIGQAMGDLSEAPIYIDDTPGLSAMEIRAKARRLQAQHNVQMVIVDYLQLIEGKESSDGNRVQEMSNISRSLKALARELDVPVLALSQLSRAVENRDPQIPRLSDLRESGCLTGDTIINDAQTGGPYTIKELAESNKKIKVWAMNDEFKVKPVNMKRAYCSGTKEVYKIKLASGKEIKASANHPFYTINGWKRLDQLDRSQRIATPRVVSQEKSVDADDNRIKLLAHLIGDGCYLARQPLHYTNKERENINLVKNVAEKSFNIKPRIVKQKNWYHLYLSAKEHLTHGVRNPIAKWLDEINIFNQRSKSKVIPKFVFELSNKKLKTFISHLWATDGTISRYKCENKSSRWTLAYYSSSSKLIKQLQHLLIRFNIVSTVRRMSNKKGQSWFTLNISGKDNQLTFLNEIGIFGPKAKKVKRAKKEIKTKEKNTNLDVVPKAIWEEIDKLRVDLGETTRSFHKKLGWAYSGTARMKRNISRDNLNNIISVFPNKRLNNLANSDLYWDEIKSIKHLGKEKVYDIEVPEYHNFVANDIIVHNSIEQDSDLVMFLYREDYYDPETENKNITDIIIAKHRNGPTGQIQLYFQKDQLCFKDLDKSRAGSQEMEESEVEL